MIFVLAFAILVLLGKLQIDKFSKARISDVDWGGSREHRKAHGVLSNVVNKQ